MIWEFLGLYVWLTSHFTENVRRPRFVEMREKERERIFPLASKNTISFLQMQLRSAKTNT